MQQSIYMPYILSVKSIEYYFWEFLSATSDIVSFYELDMIIIKYVVDTSWNFQINWKPINV